MGEPQMMIVMSRADLEALIETAVRRAVGEPPSASAAPSEWLDAQTAAELMSCHPKTLARWAHRGKIPSGRAGRELRFRRSDIDDYLRRTAGAHAAPMTKAG